MTHITKHTPLDKATRAIPMLYAEAFAGSNNKEFVVELYEDARLLEKAAPAMYEALKACLESLRVAMRFDDGDVFGVDHNDTVDAMGLAETALAQAEGRDK